MGRGLLGAGSLQASGSARGGFQKRAFFRKDAGPLLFSSARAWIFSAGRPERVP